MSLEIAISPECNLQFTEVGAEHDSRNTRGQIQARPAKLRKMTMNGEWAVDRTVNVPLRRRIQGPRHKNLPYYRTANLRPKTDKACNKEGPALLPGIVLDRVSSRQSRGKTLHQTSVDKGPASDRLHQHKWPQLSDLGSG